MATHSSVLAWRIPGMGEPDGLPSMGSHRVGHDRSDLAAAAVLLNSEGLVGLISPEVPLLAMWMATFLLCPYMSFHLYMNTPGVSLCVLIS